MGAGMLARAVSTFVLFPAATKIFSLRVVMMWTAFLSLLVLALYIPANTFVPLLLITIAFNFVYPNLLPAMESSASVLIQNEEVHYGKSRSFG
ncbi:hypothetical protein JQK62_24095, partial [Leptospira santarosai]|nr:hypothetical protein [Leptospira santarosai]